MASGPIDEAAMARAAGVVTFVPEPIDEADLNAYLRERGAVAAFCRSDGRDWKWPGPRPGEQGCTIRQSVLDEYAGKIADAHAAISFRAENERLFR